MKLLLRPLMWLTLQLHLLLLGAVSLIWNLAALVIDPLLPAATGRRLGRRVISTVYNAFWWLAGRSGLLEIDTAALDALRDQPGLIVVANHPSMLDALLLVARLPRSACVMKASLKFNPFLGPGARLARYICNDSPRSMVRQAVDDLRAGGQLVLFPEGTRTTQAPLNPFRPGFTLIAKLAAAPIQTVFIATRSPYLGKGWPIWRLPELPIVFQVRLGERFPPSADADGLLHDIEAYFRTGIRPLSAPAPAERTVLAATTAADQPRTS